VIEADRGLKVFYLEQEMVDPRRLIGTGGPRLRAGRERNGGKQTNADP
jgi:hypothetical protein